MCHLQRIFLIFSTVLCGMIPSPKGGAVCAREVRATRINPQQAELGREAWFPEPLLATKANNNAPGVTSISPSVYWTHEYGEASAHTLNSTLLVEEGLTSWFDITLVGSYAHNRTRGQTDTGWGDTSLQLGFQILSQEKEPKDPTIRLILAESFPTGKYDSLDPKKRETDAFGSGSFETQLIVAIEKIFEAPTHRPIKLFFNGATNYPSPTKVSGYNTYGGGEGTRGTVYPGWTLSSNLGFQYSFTKEIASTLEVFASRQWPTRFSGTNGHASDGTSASNRAPYNSLVTLAPGFAYSFKEDSYFLFGVEFNLARKNMPHFVTGIFSFQYTW